MTAATYLNEPARMRCLSGPVAWQYYLRFLRDPVDTHQTALARYGRLVALERPLPIGRRRLNIMGVGPDLNRRVLTDAASFRTAGQTMLRGSPDSSMRRLRTGLTRLNGEEHARFRKISMPPLQKDQVDLQHDRIVDVVRRATERWPVGETADVVGLLRTLTRTVAAAVLFGEDDASEILDVSQKIDTWFRGDRSAAVWLTPDLPGTSRARMMRTTEQVEAQLRRWLARRRERGTSGNDLVSLLLDARDEQGEPIADATLVGQLFILLTASHETASNTLSWTLLLLSQHRAVMADLLDELGSDPPSREQIERLPLLDAVVSESMRVLSPVPYILRVATREVEIGDLMVPEGSRVLLSLYLTHRLPELYEQPQRFIPERWHTLRRSAYEYMPFGAGPRRCIGSIFALRLMKIAVAVILQRYRLTPVDGARIDRRVTFMMTPRNGLPMTIRRQDRAFEAVTLRGDIREMVEFPR